jgi:succinate-semialdehyde dehydrogenase/glutarate-semialdehyde dehydrogenase
MATMDPKTSPLAQLKDPSLLKTDALINGEWVGGASRFDVSDPATGELLTHVANLGASEADAAVTAANAAWPAWRAKTAKERASILMRWYHLLIQHADDLARILTAEQGKPLAESRDRLRGELRRMVR